LACERGQRPVDAEHPLQHKLGPLIVTFAQVMVTDDSVLVEDVKSWPVLVVKGLLALVVVVDRHG
jgi:hypothetical protein